MRTAAAAAMTAAFFLGACGEDTPAASGGDCVATLSDPGSAGSVCIADAWVRPLAPAGRATAAYMTLKPRGGAFVLLGADAAGFDAAELHESVTSQGVTSMRPVAEARIESGDAVAFEPGGLHIMLIGPSGDAADGASVSLTLRFEPGGAVTFDAPVKRSDHGGMHHAGH